MKNKNLLLLGMFLFVSALFFVGCEKMETPNNVLEVKENTLNTEEKQLFQVSFHENIPLGEVVKIIDDYDLNVKQLNHQFMIGNSLTTGFVPIEDGVLDKAIIHQKIKEAHNSFAESITSGINTLSNKDDVPLETNNLVLEFTKQIIGNTKIEDDISVSSIFILSNDLPKALTDDVRVKSVVSKSTIIQNNAQARINCINSTSSDGFVPNEGLVFTGESTYGINNREVVQLMKWDNTSDFHATSTYEHDFFLNNYPVSQYPGTYFSRDEVNYSPKIVYGISSLPSPYLDVRYGDIDEEVSYTIGSANASVIEEDELYFSQIIIAKGDANIDNAKLTAQIGYRNPIGCYSTWCSFCDRQERVITAWNIDVPSSLYWTYPL